MAVIADILIAAALCGCEPGELLSYRVCENGDIVVIAPTGQKFVYAKILVDGKREELATKAKPEPKPRRKAPEAKKRAPAKPAASKAKDNSASKKQVSG